MHKGSVDLPAKFEEIPIIFWPMSAQYVRCPYISLYNTKERHLELLPCNLRRILGSIYTWPLSFTCLHNLAQQQWTSFLCIFQGISTHPQCLDILTGYTLHLAQNRLRMTNNSMNRSGRFLCYTAFTQWKPHSTLTFRHSLHEQTMLLHFSSTIFATDLSWGYYLFSI